MGVTLNQEAALSDGRETEMRARLGVAMVLATAAVRAVHVGMGAATAPTVLHLVLPGESQKVREVDQYGDGLRLGDRIAGRGRVNDADGARVGTAYADCVVHRRIRDGETGLWNCTYVLDLD